METATPPIPPPTTAMLKGFQFVPGRAIVERVLSKGEVNQSFDELGKVREGKVLVNFPSYSETLFFFVKGAAAAAAAGVC